MLTELLITVIEVTIRVAITHRPSVAPTVVAQSISNDLYRHDLYKNTNKSGSVEAIKVLDPQVLITSATAGRK